MKTSLLALWLHGLKFTFLCTFASFIATVPLLFFQLTISAFSRDPKQGFPGYIGLAYFIVIFPIAFTAMAGHFGIRMGHSEDSERS